MAKVSGLKEGTIEFIELEKIQTDEKQIGNRPIDKDHVAALYDSIRSSGLLQPIVVWNGGDKENSRSEVEIDGAVQTVPTAIVIAGFHRLKAIVRLSRKDPEAYASLFPNGVACTVRSGTLQDVLSDQLKENLLRKSLDNSDSLIVMKRLRDEFKLSNVQIARKIGRSEAYVSEVFSIEKNLGEEGATALSKKQITLTDALKASKKVKEARKAGKAVDAKQEIDKAKEKRKNLADKGKQREARRVGAKALYKAYTKLPRTATGNKLVILEATLAYLAGESENPPTELVGESGDSSE